MRVLPADPEPFLYWTIRNFTDDLILLASGVGARIMRPMALPVLGGILIADEVSGIFIPVLFGWARRRELRNRREQTGRGA